MLKYLTAWAFLIAATTFESFGDATVRIGLFNRAGIARAGVMLGGGVLLFGYGLMLNSLRRCRSSALSVFISPRCFASGRS